MPANSTQITRSKRFLGWCIHAFTASGACFGLLALYAIYQQKLLLAFWLMGLAVVIDAVDGMFARKIGIKQVVPEIDGSLLDNIVDFVNYAVVPCFMLLTTEMLPDYWRVLCVMLIIFSSTYQFSQTDAKTSDHFFKGFPSYWNIAVFYLFFWQLSPSVNMLILMVLSILSFVPIKYVYPSRLEYLSDNPMVRTAMLGLTVIWGAASLGLLWLYPETNHFLVAISLGYILLYMLISFYRTFAPQAFLLAAQE